jgi:hypothetical protein
VAEERITSNIESLYSQVSRPARSAESTAETIRTTAVETIDNDVLSLLLSGLAVGR